MFEFFIFFAWIMCLFYVFADIFRSHDLGGGAKTVWCIFIIIVPFLGVFVYLIARGHGMTQRSIEQQQQIQQQQAEYVAFGRRHEQRRFECRADRHRRRSCSTTARSPRRSSTR